MAFSNEFLFNLKAQEHNQIIDGCFCVRCRNMKLTQCLDFGYTNEQLHDLFTRRLLERENNLLDRLFKCTLQEIVHGMAYKLSCLQGTRYTYFKAWAKTRPEFTHLSEKEMKKFCLRVNEACDVFKSWPKIVDNLTDERMDQIDARRFSIRQFYLAKKITWCLRYNDSLRRRERNGNDLPYSEEKYNDILRYVISTGILDDMENNPQSTTAFRGRLQSDLVRRANARYRPY